MNLEPTLHILEKWPSENLQLLINELNTNGFVTDEDGTGLSSYMVEQWDEACTQFLRLHSYTGGDIQTSGAYTPVGAVYALFNEDCFDGYEIYKSLLKRFGKMKLSDKI